MQVGELAGRLSVPYRDVRYVLEQGVLPPGVDASPGRGEHRDLTAEQVFWLAIVLQLKRNGVRTPLAGQIAEYTRQAVRYFTQALGWEPGFQPFRGQFDTQYEWYVEIGDLQYIRVLTSAETYGEGHTAAEWGPIGKRQKTAKVSPVVVLRLDLAELARRMTA